jgi:hypothetical protein
VDRVDSLYEKYENNWMKENPPFSGPYDDVCCNKWEFIDKLLFDDDFYQNWGENCCIELTEEERYNLWFNNNYETGMERYFDPNNLPDYDNDYYEPTPKRKLK